MPERGHPTQPAAEPSHPDSRMRPGGDLYIRPKTREEMLAPLEWHERQLGVCRRYGVLADGSIGYEVVARGGVEVPR